MTELTPLSNIPEQTLFNKGDVFVLFGELFGRGYVNGLVERARAAGMTIIGITVGRRDEENRLRPLNDEELAEAEDNLGGRIINIPLMAGFDLDAPEGEPTPTELLGSMTLKSWQEDTLDWAHIERCRQIGVERFQNAMAAVEAELEGLVPSGVNVYFAHTMAGGIPRVKVFLAIANKIYKGRGKRFLSTTALFDSDLGKLILMNFDEVTANSFKYLIDGTTALRQRIETEGGQVRYSAYGYHGTKILINDEYHWQTYTSYSQGAAKMRLEHHAQEAWQNGIKATVFNCPEIRTSSSDIFMGVELSLYPLLQALKKEGGGAWADEQWAACAALLSDDCSLEELLQQISDYNNNETIAALRNYEAWPMDNSPELAEVMLGTSEAMVAYHKDKDNLITEYLSGLVLEASGQLMFNEMAQPSAPVLWLNHDILAKQLNQTHS